MNLKALNNKKEELNKKAVDSLNSAKNLEDLSSIYKSFLGKNGELNVLLRTLSSLPEGKRKEAGKSLNALKKELEELYILKTSQLKNFIASKKLEKEQIDVTLPGRKGREGSLHPVSSALISIGSFFENLGFDLEVGPETETDYYNFEALNIPQDHPAKDMHDTFYLNTKELLRTHTSPVQIRAMENKKPPLRIICPGKVYRKDSDLTHTPMFHQVEGLVLEPSASFSQLKGLLNEFLNDFFEKEVNLRFRPSYFPFTEPSAEVDIKWGNKWLEVLGCGMVHPNVLDMAGIDSTKYSGFAFGLGVERLAMLKYNISDLRSFFENDIRFLKQF